MFLYRNESKNLENKKETKCKLCRKKSFVKYSVILREHEVKKSGEYLCIGCFNTLFSKTKRGKKAKLFGAHANKRKSSRLKNSETLKKGDLVLIDSGAEVECCSDDISRPFAGRGKCCEEQLVLW